MNPQMNMYAQQPSQPSWAPSNVNGNTPSPVQQQQQPQQPQHLSSQMAGMNLGQNYGPPKPQGPPTSAAPPPQMPGNFMGQPAGQPRPQQFAQNGPPANYNNAPSPQMMPPQQSNGVQVGPGAGQVNRMPPSGQPQPPPVSTPNQSAPNANVMQQARPQQFPGGVQPPATTTTFNQQPPITSPAQVQNQMPLGPPHMPPALSRQQMPGQPMSGQQQIPGQQPIPGQQRPQIPGQQMPGHQGMQPGQQQMPPMPGQPGMQQGQQQMPPMPGQHLSGHQGSMPSMPGQQGMQQGQQQMPPMPGMQQGQQQMPPMPGMQQGQQQMPPMPGMQQGQQQMPPMPGMQQGQQQMPGQLPGHQGSMPPMPGQQGMQQGQQQMPPMPGQQGMQPGQQQMSGPMGGAMPGQPQYPPMPGQMPQQNMYNSMASPGMQPGQAPPSGYGPISGQMAPPGQQPSVPGRPYNPQFPGQQPSYNQMPGGQQQQQFQQGGAQPYQAGGMAPQQSRRLDPDAMPNPIQVMADNQKLCSGVFATNQPGLVPPLVTTQFITQDQGNSGPRFMRSTMYSVPATTEIMKQAAVPFSLIISPMARTIGEELQPPIVDFGEVGPIRCVRCKAYMSPNMQFIDGGRRFQCLLCKATTEVPAEYFQHLDHTGQRVDKYERPELVLGTYEFVATKDYCRNNKFPNPPAMVFVIDVSYNNIKSGLVHLLCAEMKNIIQHLPIDQGLDRSKMKVGFITYNNTVHFYNCKSNLAQPQMMVVGDVHEMFMPLLDGFLCDAEESSSVIDALMSQIPKMFGETRETETILLPALQAGLEALKASETCGKLLVFHSSLPIAEAPGKLKNRDDRKLLGTEKEKTVLTPQCQTYNNLGQECVAAGCSVDLFVLNNSYIDIATIGQVSRLTGGEVYKYTYFQADIDGARLVQDIIKNISRPVAFDTVMRVRTSTGVRPTDFYGHFFMSNTTDMEIAAIDCEKSIAIEIKHDDKLSPEENVYVQVALLYTSSSGQRRLRVLNLCLKTCSQLADLFKSCDLDSCVLFLAKQGMFKLMDATPKQVKDNLINRAAQILACYRKNCASPSSAGQLILPECMKLLPLYVSCLLKNDAFSGGSDITCDDRSFVIQYVLAMDLPTSVTYFYPRLIPIHGVNPEEEDVPKFIRCTSEKIADDGAYILENGIHMFLWLGLGLSPEFTQSVFGAQCTQQIDTERCGLPVFDNPLSRRVRGIVDKIQDEKSRCMRLTLIRQRDKLESVLRHFFVEDRGSDGSASYVDFLCHMHKEIRALLS